MNGNSKTVLVAIASMIIGAVGAVFATNPKARDKVWDSSAETVGKVKSAGKKVRERVRNHRNRDVQT